MVVIVVLYGFVFEGRESNCRGMQPGHVNKQPLDRVTAHVAKMYNPIKCLLRDYGSRLADKIKEMLHHLKKIPDVIGKRGKIQRGGLNSKM